MDSQHNFALCIVVAYLLTSHYLNKLYQKSEIVMHFSGIVP